MRPAALATPAAHRRTARPSHLAGPIAVLSGGAGRDEADRHARRGVGVQPAGPGVARRPAPRRSAWRPWPAAAASEQVIKEEGDKPLVPGSPLSIAMVTGDFDLSGIGTVTHVEGNRVYGFGHPMMSLGACEFPMMTGYIHTVYPRASVSMKMGSPLKIVGVIDTDVSTGVAGRLGKKPDMLPMTVKVKRPLLRAADLQGRDGPRAEPAAHARDGRLDQRDRHRRQPARGADRQAQGDHQAQRATTRSSIDDTLSGAAVHRADGAAALFGPIAVDREHLVVGTRWPRSGSRRSTARSRSPPGRTVATDRVGPPGLRPARAGPDPEGVRHSQAVSRASGRRSRSSLPLPADFARGQLRGDVCDMTNSLRRRFRNEPQLLEPRDVDGDLAVIRVQTEPKRTALYLHVPLPDRGLAVAGPGAAEPPGSVRAVFATSRQTHEPPVRSDLVRTVETPLGRSRAPIAQVHRRQGHGALAEELKPDSSGSTRRASDRSPDGSAGWSQHDLSTHPED